ncbi:glycosyltransferase family 4 protein [Bosea sp. CS1GBMeth4]|uniref:glycosyltransferase family 4 protein n=1 Tax=Bosea sp. CS1GBMeth4 TaxID=1892849 RepID=UPI001645F5E5|nr:glycosyltransferase family 4 protein [Bosea sp. CS1GBMeth4]
MTADAVGGVLTYALDLATGLARHEVRTTLALLGPAPSEGQRRLAAAIPGLRLVETGLPLDWLAENPEVAETTAREISDLARRHGADLVHLNTPALAIASFESAVVSVVHSCLASWWAAVKGGPLPADFRWRTQVMAQGIAASDTLVCPSSALATEIERIYGRRPAVVHNGRAPAELPPHGARPHFALTAGRLWDEAKDIATLDAAAGFTELPVLAAGPTTGPNGSRIELRRLQGLGPVGPSDVRALLARRPIFVATALYEPFGLAVLEAAQAGCALVLSEIPTFRELWDGAAVFVPARNAEAFGRALTQLAAAPERRAILGAAAKERARRYAVEAMAAQMLEIYAAAAGRERRRREGAAA